MRIEKAMDRPYSAECLEAAPRVQALIREAAADEGRHLDALEHGRARHPEVVPFGMGELARPQGLGHAPVALRPVGPERDEAVLAHAARVSNVVVDVAPAFPRADRD